MVGTACEIDNSFLSLSKVLETLQLCWSEIKCKIALKYDWPQERLAHLCFPSNLCPV